MAGRFPAALLSPGALGCCNPCLGTQKSCKKGNQKVVGIERDGYRSSGPTPLAKQGHLVPVAEDKVQMAFKYLKE